MGIFYNFEESGNKTYILSYFDGNEKVDID